MGEAAGVSGYRSRRHLSIARFLRKNAWSQFTEQPTFRRAGGHFLYDVFDFYFCSGRKVQSLLSLLPLLLLLLLLLLFVVVVVVVVAAAAVVVVVVVVVVV